MASASSCKFGTLPVKNQPPTVVIGQERFRTITTAYYRGAMGILLVYDVTDERSFNNIRNWIKNTEQYAMEGVNRILIGNKCDMVERRAVSREQAQALADEYGIRFIETSAKSAINVEEAFLSLTKDIKRRLIDGTAAENKRPGGGVQLQGQEGEEAGSVFKSCCYK